jgi:hypothetical protein
VAHKDLVKEAQDAIGAVFGDMDVDREQTKQSLEEIQETVNDFLEIL